MKTAHFTGIVTVLMLAAVFSANAQQVYIANESQSKLQLLNLATSQFTTLYKIGGKPDDLILNANGQLLYTIPESGTINQWDPVTQQNTVIVSNLKWARDLEIEPGGQTMLIAVYAPGEIVRYNFTTGTTTTLIKKLGSCDGVKYDPYGNLYAVANHNTIIQINPATGAIIHTLVLEPHHGVNGGDGLTYDSFSNSLWATHDGTTGAGLLQIPVGPSGFTPAGFTFFPSTKYAAPDGIKSDGKGNLYVGSIATFFVYNIPTNTVTTSLVASGADGVSLVPGTY
jgi:sugar lactone lactonase YvrE